MKIMVCLKLIANPDTIEYDLAGERLCNVDPILDPVSYQVLEEGIRLRELLGGEVIALSVAPETGEVLVQEALFHGADRALRVWHEGMEGADTFVVAQLLSTVMEKVGFDLILCGVRSSDQGSEFMVSLLSHSLTIPSATRVISLSIDQDKNLLVHKKLQRGERELYRLQLPAVLGLEPGINEPRYVAPFSRVYQEGLRKKVEYLPSARASSSVSPLTAILQYTQPRPRVKVGIDISSLSMPERLAMMRGELNRTRELCECSPETAVKKILGKLEEFLK